MHIVAETTPAERAKGRKWLRDYSWGNLMPAHHLAAILLADDLVLGRKPQQSMLYAYAVADRMHVRRLARGRVA